MVSGTQTKVQIWYWFRSRIFFFQKHKFFSPNFYYFFLGAHAKFFNPMTTPSVVLNSGGNNKKKRLIPKTVWQCMHFAQTNMFCKQTSSKKIVFPNFNSPHLFTFSGRKVFRLLCSAFTTKFQPTHFAQTNK